MPVLARTWQMLLKGLQEVRGAPAPLAAAEMVLVRLGYAADLPSPGELVKEWRDKGGAGGGSGGGAGMTPVSRGGANGGGASALAAQAVSPAAQPNPVTGPLAQAQQNQSVALAAMPQTFAALVALFGEMREGLLGAELENYVHPVHFEPGRIEWRQQPLAARNLAAQVAEKLQYWTGERWIIALSNQPGEPTLAEKASHAASARRAQAEAHPLVQAVLAAFPGAELKVSLARPPVQEVVADTPGEADGPAYMSDNDIDPLDELD
jgi:DNA polymerase-3 subunit gamma/tau